MAVKTLLSVEDYLLQEVKADQKSEYHNGEVKMMAGASHAHNEIVSNTLGELFQCLKKLGCRLYANDMLVYQPDCNRYVYPDISILCEEPILDKNERAGVDVLLNPQIIIEVLSSSTALYDRSEKFDCYKKIPSLGKYMLIDSQKMWVEVFEKTPQGWLGNTYKLPEDVINIAKCELILEDIYRNLKFS